MGGLKFFEVMMEVPTEVPAEMLVSHPPSMDPLDHQDASPGKPWSSRRRFFYGLISFVSPYPFPSFPLEANKYMPWLPPSPGPCPSLTPTTLGQCFTAYTLTWCCTQLEPQCVI